MSIDEDNFQAMSCIITKKHQGDCLEVRAMHIQCGLQ